MPTGTDLATFLSRHRFQHVRTSALGAAGSTDVSALAATDLNGNGDVSGDDELRALYTRLLALDAGATTVPATTGSRAGNAYGALRAMLVARTGVEAALGTQRLRDVPELAGVLAGAATLARNSVTGAGASDKTLGTGSVQDALIACGFAIDLGAGNANRGIFGGKTEAAVKLLQASAGLAQSGVVDKDTLVALSDHLDAIRAPVTPPVVTPPAGTPGAARFTDAAFAAVRAGTATLGVGASGDAVKAIQQALLDMGFSVKPWVGASGALVGGVDGGFGAQSENALKNFQRHARAQFPAVQATGALDNATLAALEALAPAPGAFAWSEGSPKHAPVPYWEGDPAKRLRVVVVRDQHRTFLFDAAGQIDKIYSNAHGAPGSPTHSGFKKITGRLDEATAKSVGQNLWQDEKAFGTRILDLSWASGAAHSGEELHGTYNRKDMGKDVSHGCMRHYNEDIEEMFAKVTVGDLVAVVDSIDDPRLRA